MASRVSIPEPQRGVLTVSLQHAPDSALVERMMAGDESALSTLYDRYSGMIYSMLFRILRDAHAAEEILQDLFLQLWRNASHFDETRGSLPAWLMVIGRNRALSHLRRREFREPADNLDTAFPEGAVPSSVNIENETQQAELLQRLRVAMEALPPEQRTAVELAYFEGMTQTEIAARTGAPLGTVKTRVRTAMQYLKQIFENGTTRQSGRP